ncbi:membrane protein insertion efficiency factor YidD [Candidatus Parcubacteria bacterium]|nr:MAG: membrane protein insertion efficiency factor YidD [Candidatus Parcubacteria bacterium]
MTRLLIWFINLYQKTLSPNHSWLKGYSGFCGCRYFPTCSQYSKEALCRHGLFKGAILSVKRVSRCFGSSGGIDELL